MMSTDTTSVGAPRAPVLFEVCIDSVESGLAAQAGGAGRVELCDNLVDGGTTPSLGMVAVLLNKLSIPINVIIRPRGGDFLYSDVEMEVMLADIDAMKSAGVSGIAIGVLCADGTVDKLKTKKLIECARPMTVTFHRAFDVTPDYEASLEACIDLGVDRILTSGLRPCAAECASKRVLSTLVEKSGDRCTIMAGAGITTENLAEIVRETCVREVHASAGRVSLPSCMTYRPADPIHLGAEKLNTIDSEFVRKVVTAERVQAYVDILEHPDREFENGCCPVASATEPTASAEIVSIATVLPSKFEYPPGVSAIISHVERAVSSIEGASVHAFGSAVNGFGDRSSDVDLVLEALPSSLKKGLDLGKVGKKDLVSRSLAFLQRYLRQQGFTVVEKVLHAKVPILKLRHRGVDCDLSCNNLLPVFNTRLLKAYSDVDLRLVELTQTVKAWARKHGIHGAPHGHLSSYAFTLLCIFYMQMRGALPCLQSKGADSPQIYSDGEKTYNVAMDLSTPAAKKSHIAISFSDFVQFYLTDYTWGDCSVVSVRTGMSQGVSSYPELKLKLRNQVGEKEARDLLHIEDPFDVCRNLNCVMNSGSTIKLWCALERAAAEKATPPPATAAVPATASFSALGINAGSDERRTWRSSKYNKIRQQ